MMALQKAVKNTRPERYNSGELTERRQTVERSSGEREGSRRHDTNMDGVRAQQTNTVVDNKHVLLHWCVSHAGVITTRYEEAHDGKTAYQKI